MSFPYYLDSKVTSLLKRWVQNGGCLVSEAFFGAVLAENGLHSRSVPGYGFTEVFGAREGLTVTATGFRNAYTDTLSGTVDYRPVNIKMTEKSASICEGDIIEGHFFMERLIPEDAKVLGMFEDGSSAITINRYDKGSAVLIGSLLGFSYYKTGMGKISHFMGELAEEAGAVRHVKVEFGAAKSVTTTGGKVRADILSNDQKDVILVINSFSDAACSITVKIYTDIGVKTRMINILTGEELELDVMIGADGVSRADVGGYKVRIDIGSFGHEVFRLE
jgi:beta-galactosidase